MTVAGLSSIRHNRNGALQGAETEALTVDPLSAEQGKEVPTPLVKPVDGRSKRDALMSSLYAMPAEMAAPVARGHMPLEHAYAALLATTVAAERSGQLEPYKAPDVFRLQKHLLGQRLDAELCRRALAEHRIARRLKPLIASHKPFNALFAEAHDVNGTDGFPLEEAEVNDIVKTEIYWSLPAGRRSHG